MRDEGLEAVKKKLLDGLCGIDLGMMVCKKEVFSAPIVPGRRKPNS